jgi:hypothetical protein
MPALLSKIVSYVNSDLKHRGVLKVSLTLRGWVPSSPVPSGVYISLMTRMMKSTLASIDMDIDSEEGVM